MASTSGSVPYPTSSSTTDDAASGLSSGTGSVETSATASSAGTASANGAMGASAQPVVDRVAESAHRVVDQLAGKAGPAVDRLRSSVYGARETMGQRMTDLTHTRDEWMDSARESVRRNPLAAVGLAAAIGYVLARLTSHER